MWDDSPLNINIKPVSESDGTSGLIISTGSLAGFDLRNAGSARLKSYPAAECQSQCKFSGLRKAKQLAPEAVPTANINEEDESRTVDDQDRRTKAAAIEELARRWHQSPRNSLAYHTALTRPPDGRIHPTFHPSKGTAQVTGGQKTPLSPGATLKTEPSISTSTCYALPSLR
jgi:hypothetical protein